VVGLRTLLFATASCMFAQILPLGRQQGLRYDRSSKPSSRSGPPDGEGAVIDLRRPDGDCEAGDTIKFGYLLSTWRKFGDVAYAGP
jgi:SET family sugar efflux transporter-like MFS transporter